MRGTAQLPHNPTMYLGHGVYNKWSETTRPHESAQYSS
jgi:hypothetical protein